MSPAYIPVCYPIILFTYLKVIQSNLRSKVKIRFRIINESKRITDFKSIDQGIKIYPNPAKQFINVSLSGPVDDDAVISIFSLTGTKVATYEVSGKINTLPTHMLVNGIYMIKLTSANRTTIGRFVVRK